MLTILWIVLTYPFTFFRRRHDLALEALALRRELSGNKALAEEQPSSLLKILFNACLHGGMQVLGDHRRKL